MLLSWISVFIVIYGIVTKNYFYKILGIVMEICVVVYELN